MRFFFTTYHTILGEDIGSPYILPSHPHASDRRPDLAGSAVLELEHDGSPVAIRKMPSEHDDIVRFIRHRNPFNHMTVACRRDLIEQCRGYPDIFSREDYALWAKIVKAGARCANLPEVLVHATAGRDMYRHRGVRSAMAERGLQALLVKLGLKSHA